jgi:hypothetical protein
MVSKSGKCVVIHANVFSLYSLGLTDCTLPVEIIGIIAKQLVADDARCTCAALSLTCQAVHQETSRALWRVVVQWGARILGKMPVRFADELSDVLRKRARKEVLEEMDSLSSIPKARNTSSKSLPDNFKT